MKTLFITSILILSYYINLSGQLIEAEGNIKLDNTLELYDRSSGEAKKVGTIQAAFPTGAGSLNSPTLILRTETSPLSSNGFADILLESSDAIYLNTNTSTRMFVGPSGRVGIGTESPSKLFHVTDDIVVGGGSEYEGASEHIRFAAQNDNWYVGALNENTEAASDFIIGTSSAESELFHLENNGDLGLGTSNPATKLDIHDSGNNPLKITTTVDDNFTTYWTDNGYIGYQGVYTDKFDMDFGTAILNNVGSVHLVTKTIPRFTIEPDGQIGIGTTTPSAHLHISGGNQSVELLLSADENNVGEDDQPKLTLSQDGGQVTGEVSYYNSTNDLRVRNNFGGSAIILKGNGDIIIGNN